MHGGVLAISDVASTTQQITFWLLAVVSVTAALGMILVRKAVYCAVLLAVVMLSLAALYALQNAPFLAFVQIIVYTGAVLMLFLFVLMIVGIRAKDSLVETIKGQRVAAGLAAIGLLVLLSLTVGHAVLGTAAPAGGSFGANNVYAIAKLIFTTYVFPFEVTSALLITAALGAMVLAHRERIVPKLTQRDLSRLRVASGRPAAGARCWAAGPRSAVTPAPRPRRKVTPDEPRELRGPRRDPVRDRRGGCARAAQRDGDIHVRRAHAQRGQPRVRGLRADARQPGRPGDRVLRDGGRGR
jgi:NADH:ubiquinone oxidoreductase subunit 6 (subunit J)